MDKQLKIPRQTGEFTLYLLRHGEIATPGILAGKTDVALSEQGVQQILQVTDSLVEVERCISSPLIRCYERANYFAKQNDLSLIVEDRLQEMNFGDWDGKSYHALWHSTDSSARYSIGDFWQDPWKNPAPNGETMQMFTRRVDDWWQALCRDDTLQNTLVFTHAGVIKHIVARVLEMPIHGTEHMSSIEVPYAGLIKISIYRDEQAKVWTKLVL
ncbi:histidine phosphatase family protein [Litorilituus lipolyticus]|uniref:Histidine phosphatase family protein n=1 Tax=Litorilituus lipolyticus TaxID=2491017 RepID=A0A502KZU3_9GAMM|nr:histidine phosphatase family protein [Litorilituus lipolyticus]TPH15735.1 hypothetical protein EPA86_09190 [Litorilituus lipolyticus]